MKAKARGRLITVLEAARRLGVHHLTVRAWLRTGRLQGVEKKRKVVVTKVFVYSAGLKDAHKVKCLLCGKVFTAVHPGKAMFCCPLHKTTWYNRRKRAARRRG